MEIISVRKLNKILNEDNKTKTERVFPEIVKRIIEKETSESSYINIPVGDDTSLPGFDGIVKNNENDSFLPRGDSLLEIGTRKDFKEKIKEDFDKRAKDSVIENKGNFTYVAVTSRIIETNDKIKLESEYNKKNVFKNIKIIDLNDIKEYLNKDINLLRWFYAEFEVDYNFENLRFLDEEYQRIRIETNGHSSNNLYILNNIKNAERLIKKIKDKTNRVININSLYGKTFSYCYCVTVLKECNDKTIKDNVVIVKSLEDLLFVDRNFKNKIILVNFNSHVDGELLNLHNIYIFFDSIIYDKNNLLNNIEPIDLEKEIANFGFTAEEARNIAYHAGYNPLALIRISSSNELSKKPVWSYDKNKNKLIPLLLLGVIDFEKIDNKFLKFLNVTNIDEYIQNLNYFLELEDSPIYNDGDIYRFSLRKEGFDFIKINLSLDSLKFLENYVVSQITDEDNSKKNYKEFIYNIFDGFILLSKKSEICKKHFDKLAIKIFNKLLNNEDLIYIFSDYFCKLGELSEEYYLEFLDCLFKGGILRSFLNKICDESKNKFLTNIYDGLFYCLIKENTCLSALNDLIKIYLISGNDLSLKKLVYYFSLLSSIDGGIPAKFENKVEFLISNTDLSDNKKKTILKKIFEEDNFFIETLQIYENDSDIKEEVILNDASKSYLKIYKYLNECSSDFEKADLLSSAFGSIFRQRMIFDQFVDEMELQINKINKKDDIYKAKLLEVFRYYRSHIPDNPDKYYSNIKDFLIKNINQVNLDDPFLKYKNYILKDELDETNYEIKVSKEDALKELIIANKENIFKLIDEVSKRNIGIWDLIFKIYKNHLELIEYMIKKENEIAFKNFSNKLEDEELLTILEKYCDNKFVIENLPFKSVIYKNICFTKDLEKVFWLNRKIERVNKTDFEYLFEKFLKFNPFCLISYFSKNIDELTLEYAFAILNEIKFLYKRDYQLDKYDLIDNRYYEDIGTFINKIDEFNKDEIFYELEISILPFLIHELHKCPLVVQRNFAKNPEQFIKYISLLETKIYYKEFNYDEWKLYQDCNLKNNRFALLTSDVIQSETSIKEWCAYILKRENIVEVRKHDCVGYDSSREAEFIRTMHRIIFKILSTYDYRRTYEVWPSYEVCEIIENLFKNQKINVVNVKEEFIEGFKTQINLNVVDSFGKIIILSELFKKHSNFYRFKYVFISNILDDISDYFKINVLNNTICEGYYECHGIHLFNR